MKREELVFFSTPPHRCSYLPEAEAVTLFADPRTRLDRGVYSTLSRMGFRRSGNHVYRPRCPNCAACVPVRIPVDDFTPSRRDRRTRTGNADLEINIAPPRFELEHFNLYERYLRARHRDGGMDVTSPEQYMSFLCSAWCDSLFVEFRAGRKLVCVAVTDVLEDGYSAVYTFFEPRESRRALGRFAILTQIDMARRQGKPFVYLGYWIQDSPKMAYKADYQPLEEYSEGAWRPFERDRPRRAPGGDEDVPEAPLTATQVPLPDL